MRRQQCVSALTFFYCATILVWNAALHKINPPPCLGPPRAGRRGWLAGEFHELQVQLGEEWQHNVYLRISGWYMAIGISYLYALTSALSTEP